MIDERGIDGRGIATGVEVSYFFLSKPAGPLPQGTLSLGGSFVFSRSE
jgi:hypothetical protein